MPSRPDLREIASNVKEAFSEMDREALLEILTFVVKEYVVEGPPPMLVHQAETLADLKNISFAQLITSLQTRFDFAELAMFVVDGEQVSVRIGGVVQPLLAPRTPPPGLPPAMIDTRPQAGVRVVETTLVQSPQGQRPPGPTNPSTQPGSLPARPAGQIPAPSTSAAAAPPPRAGLSVRGAPTGAEAPRSAPPPASPAPPPAAPAAAAPEEKKPEGGGDDASARFSLLELD
jgi:hypothetical protein